ncbi:hypothetical protein U9M48_030818 [Paspalum notatum var. saurae]|uniref:Uncharacterized protein n=1 Tax=Paspalum notatum var. saurae TaxID=547442 RepID=A0AAQ3X315_PASNO
MGGQRQAAARDSRSSERVGAGRAVLAAAPRVRRRLQCVAPARIEDGDVSNSAEEPARNDGGNEFQAVGLGLGRDQRARDQEAQWQATFTDFTRALEDRVGALEHAAAVFDEWRPGMEGLVDDIKLEVGRLSKHWERAVMEKPLDIKGVLASSPTAAERPPAGSTAERPHGHRVESSHRVDGYGGVYTMDHHPVKGAYTRPSSRPPSPHKLFKGDPNSWSSPGMGSSGGGHMGRLPKLNFPVFDGENPKLWLRRSKDYFDMYDVDPSLWIQIRQTSTVADYAERFTAIVDQLIAYSASTDPLYYAQCFINGLRPDIRATVFVQRPSSLDSACVLAMLQEEIVKAGRRSDSRRYDGNFAGKQSFRGAVSLPLQPRSSAGTVNTDELKKSDMDRGRPMDDELAALRAFRRSKGLCQRCAEKWSKDHRCPPSVQLHAIEKIWDCLQLTDEVTVDSTGDDSVSEQLFLTLSVAAVQGLDSPRTMRFQGLLQGHSILVLVDSGSSHTFLSSRVADQVVGVSALPVPIAVQVADGGRLQCGTQLVQAHWQLDHCHFYTDMKILDLSHYDLIQSTVMLQGIVSELRVGTVVEVAALTAVQHDFSTMGLHPSLTQLLESYAAVFDKPTGLPPARSCDHAIPLVPGVSPVHIRPYRYPPAVKDEIERQVVEMLHSGIIQHSQSAFSSPVLLVKKKDLSWRFCVDFHHLNAITVKTSYPVPIIEELLDELGQASWFTSLDLTAGYHQILLQPGEGPKTTFQTHTGHYEFRLVLEVLAKDQWKVKLSKCTFASQQIAYLGHVISAGGVATDPSKVTAVSNWPTPKSVKELRSFLGLAGYYRRFVRHFGVIARPLNDLLKKGALFIWTSQHEEAFQALKKALITAPILALPNFSLPFCIETDASGVGVGAVLMQQGHPLAYLIKALGPRTLGLSAYEKEYLAILIAVEHWRHYLQLGEFIIFTDHRSLAQLTEQRLHTPWQQKVFTRLLGLQYKVVYKKGAENSAADALSRYSFASTECSALSVAKPQWIAEIVASYQQDPQATQLLAKLSLTPDADPHFTLSDGVLRYNGRIWIGSVPLLHAKLINAFHSSAIGGHSGIPVTLARLKQLFAWKGMKSAVKSYVQNCQVYKHHGLPQAIVSDRDRIFLSQFWQQLFKLADVQLPTGHAPFQLLYGCVPRQFGITDTTVVAPDDLAIWLHERQLMTDVIRQHLERAKMRMKRQADKGRSECEFQVGDWVFLKLQPYVQSSLAPRANQKLAFKFFGPFHIIARVGAVAYKLQLPELASIHPVFHVSQLKEDVGAGYTASTELPNDSYAWSVPMQILDRRTTSRGVDTVPQVLVRWSHMPASLATWEDAEALQQQFPRAAAWGHPAIQEEGNVSNSVEEPARNDGGNEFQAVGLGPGRSHASGYERKLGLAVGAWERGYEACEVGLVRPTGLGDWRSTDKSEGSSRSLSLVLRRRRRRRRHLLWPLSRTTSPKTTRHGPSPRQRSCTELKRFADADADAEASKIGKPSGKGGGGHAFGRAMRFLPSTKPACVTLALSDFRRLANNAASLEAAASSGSECSDASRGSATPRTAVSKPRSPLLLRTGSVRLLGAQQREGSWWGAATWGKEGACPRSPPPPRASACPRPPPPPRIRPREAATSPRLSACARPLSPSPSDCARSSPSDCARPPSPRPSAYPKPRVAVRLRLPEDAVAAPGRERSLMRCLWGTGAAVVVEYWGDGVCRTLRFFPLEVMDRVVRVFHGGIIRENGEFEDMREKVEIFDSPPTYFELVARTKRLLGGVGGQTEVMLRGRFDTGKARAHYVVMNISSDFDWLAYKEIVKSSNVTCCEVVAELQTMSDFVRVKKEAVEAMLNLGEGGHEAKGQMVRDGNSSPNIGTRMDSGSYEDSRDVGSRRTLDMCDNINLADEGEESVEDEEDEGDQEDEEEELEDEEDEEGDEEEEEEADDEEVEGGSADHRMVKFMHAPDRTWADFLSSLPEEERAMLEVQNVPLPEVHFHEDVTRADLAICDTGLRTIIDTGLSTKAIIEEGLRFETLEKLQDFLRDYSVRHHRPFKVKHLDDRLRYTVVCSQECPWLVHGRRDKRLGGWKITSVKQPHTCRSSETKRVHRQNTSKYIGRHIAGVIAADPEVKIKALIASIKAITGYEVNYSKAWRAKQYMMEMVYGDWNESYNLLPRVLGAMEHFNPTTRWYCENGDTITDADSGKTATVLKRVFWCFGQSVEAFKHCRPMLLVDGTFLIGKYKGVLMMATAVDPEDQLVPMAFTVVEGENKDSWEWMADPQYLLLDAAYEAKHRAGRIADGKELPPLQGRTHTQHLSWDERYAPFIQEAGLLHLARVVASCLPPLDPALLTALIDRWSPETHSFHLPCGERTITLQDTTMILGLPIDGQPVIHRLDSNAWSAQVHALFSVAPSQRAAGDRATRTSGVTTGWLRNHFGVCPPDAWPVEVERHARAWLWFLLACFLLPDSSGDTVDSALLPILDRPWAAIATFSWGTAILGHLYRQLCETCQCKETSSSIGGCLYLLQDWPFEDCRPTVLWLWRDVEVVTGWIDGRYRRYTNALDYVTHRQVEWTPYSRDEIEEANLSPLCYRDEDLWRAVVPLIYFVVVEYHIPTRVLRQFGRRQVVPPHTVPTDPSLHRWDMRERVPVEHGEAHDKGYFVEYLRWWQAHARVRLRTTADHRPICEVDSDESDKYDTRTRQGRYPERAPIEDYVVEVEGGDSPTFGPLDDEDGDDDNEDDVENDADDSDDGGPRRPNVLSGMDRCRGRPRPNYADPDSDDGCNGEEEVAPTRVYERQKNKGNAKKNQSDKVEAVPPPAQNTMSVSQVLREAYDTTPRRPINYSEKGHNDQLKEFRFKDETIWQRHRGIEGVRFNCQTHVDFYNSVVCAKVNQPVLKQRCIDWERCKGMNDRYMDEALAIIENRGLKDIMTFHRPWNSEVIAQFYSTLWIEMPKKARGSYRWPYLHFNIQGERYKCSYRRFAHILGFTDSDISKEKVWCHEYDMKPIDDIVLDMHLDPNGKLWVSSNMKPTMHYLNHLFRATVVPKGGNTFEIRGVSRAILWLLHPENEEGSINVFNLIYEEEEVHGPGGHIEEDIHGDNIPPPPPSSWHEAACSWPRWD